MSDLLTSLKEQREERVRDLHLDLPIPTWDGALVARFDVMDRSKVERFAKQKRTVEADQDFIINSVRELYALDKERIVTGAQRMAGNEDYVRVEDESGAPVKFDAMLATQIGEPELTKAREVLMYCVKNNAIAIGGLAARLIQWMQNTDAEVADALAGES